MEGWGGPVITTMTVSTQDKGEEEEEEKNPPRHTSISRCRHRQDALKKTTTKKNLVHSVNIDHGLFNSEQQQKNKKKQQQIK